MAVPIAVFSRPGETVLFFVEWVSIGILPALVFTLTGVIAISRTPSLTNLSISEVITVISFLTVLVITPAAAPIPLGADPFYGQLILGAMTLGLLVVALEPNWITFDRLVTITAFAAVGAGLLLVYLPTHEWLGTGVAGVIAATCYFLPAAASIPFGYSIIFDYRGRWTLAGVLLLAPFVIAFSKTPAWGVGLSLLDFVTILPWAAGTTLFGIALYTLGVTLATYQSNELSK